MHLNHADTEQLIHSADINAVAFTGSVAGGEMVERAAAGRFIHIGLELGGKDPAYVRADADLQHAVETVMDGAFFNSGQSCCGIERVYVHQDVYDGFLDWIMQMRLELGIESTLAEIGIDTSQIDRLATMATEDAASGSNPIVFTPQQYKDILYAACNGL